MAMNRREIEREVRRLSPWYYLYDLDGVRTDITPPCDRHGHRSVSLPAGARRFLAGRTVLDVACNEGGYSFAALDAGAAHVTGFDVRAVNVEKARFVARVQERTNADFHVASCDSWLERDAAPVDVVFLCGLLYHLVEPWKTIEQYCRLAREGVFVTCVLAGGPDGYTGFPEQENIAASADPSLLSQMPNTSRTILREFEKHSFLPRFIGESRSEHFWGGCSLFLQSFADSRWRRTELDPAESDIELYLIPHRPESPARKREIDVLLYNRSASDRELLGTLRASDASGRLLRTFGPERIVLPAQVSSPAARPSESVSFTVGLDSLTENDSLTLEALVQERETVVAHRKLSC